MAQVNTEHHNTTKVDSLAKTTSWTLAIQPTSWGMPSQQSTWARLLSRSGLSMVKIHQFFVVSSVLSLCLHVFAHFTRLYTLLHCFILFHTVSSHRFDGTLMNIAASHAHSKICDSFRLLRVPCTLVPSCSGMWRNAGAGAFTANLAMEIPPTLGTMHMRLLA